MLDVIGRASDHFYTALFDMVVPSFVSRDGDEYGKALQGELKDLDEHR